MAMNNHMEARRRQMFMERVCAARKRLELAENQKESQEAGTSNAYSIQSDSKLNTAQGPSKTARLVNIWIQPDPSSNRLRRDYDHSRNGPVRDQTWYALERELNYRERCFSFIKKPTTFE
ncbi:uncharacterized protein LOC106060641 isoform X3 [Biomphalaria glabrata]|uniref:Uncharacterized protein LOC106060641 isoform X3 n=1 Tax=Biomphalaria glabrata TaxID=6526 RepID=A0A2C9L2P9_BIOGL|nr:uncharacterized protein LOC106060641 isoform X3 [Biomphalaria glabrata]